MEKGNTKKDMLERFKSMGVPMPLEPIKNPKIKSSNPEKESKLDQIRNGSLKEQYSRIIEKTEKISAGPTTIPVPKVGKNPNEKTTHNAPALESFTPKRNSEAAMLDDMLYGGGSSTHSQTTNHQAPSKEISGDYGPNNFDTRTKLKEALERRQHESKNIVEQRSNSFGTNITESELNDRITQIATEVAREVSKQMIKTVILEYSKIGKDIIVESKTVKRAEIVDKDKVRIGGKIYKLSLVK